MSVPRRRSRLPSPRLLSQATLSQLEMVEIFPLSRGERGEGNSGQPVGRKQGEAVAEHPQEYVDKTDLLHSLSLTGI
jgi:hypothetical protein